MRFSHHGVLAWLAIAGLTGCGVSPAPAPARLDVRAAAMQAPSVPTPTAASAPVAAVPVLAPTVTLIQGAAAQADKAKDPYKILNVGPDDPPELVARMAAAEDPPSFRVSDRVPYGVVVVERSAHTATISWATEVPTRGLIEYGRTWGFDQHGFSEKFQDDVPSMYHKITLTGLRWFTGYQFRVTAYDALGLPFPEEQRGFRTKFWALR